MEALSPLTRVRVRFAPSPTGFLHVGNARTALFNWLVARHLRGAFILRIEDTDAERSRPEYETQLMDDLRWLGLEWDEGVDKGGAHGPYRQTDRYSLYRDHAERLLAQGRAFPCFCTEEELEEVRRQQSARGDMPRYSGKCRNLTSGQVEAFQQAGKPSVLRLRVRPGTVGFSDLVYGRIDIDTLQISDPVLLRSDGSPTYNFSVVVDDIAMEISHVIRGDGHISNTHRQILIYEALAAPVPLFAHLPTVLGPDGSKLSKRHGATSLEEFRSQGYLPEALANYLSLLGWSPPDAGKEIMDLQEIVALFELARVSRSPAIFDSAKLDWMNRSYINKMPVQALAERAVPYFAASGLIPADADARVRAWLAQVVEAVKSHVDHLDQLPRETAVIYGFPAEPPELDEVARATLAEPGAIQVAREFARLVVERETLTFEAYKEIVGLVKKATGQKGRQLFHPIRAALTGLGSGPELDRLIPIYEEGSRLNLPRRVMSCRERITAIFKTLRDES
ncbi:MAG: glutamate--tRNA ligase [Acidobacteriia bacterium]|nr:glutamate--tRNA ligase [Terriglobia bacterium]